MNSEPYYYTNGTGFIYVCAFDPTGDFTSLRRIALTGGAMSPTSDTDSIALTTSNYSECSPGTEVFNQNDTNRSLRNGLYSSSASRNRLLTRLALPGAQRLPTSTPVV